MAHIRSTHDGPVALPSENHGFAAQLWIVPLLDRSIKGIHVYMDDFSPSHLPTILFRRPDSCEHASGSTLAVPGRERAPAKSAATVAGSTCIRLPCGRELRRMIISFI